MDNVEDIKSVGAKLAAKTVSAVLIATLGDSPPAHITAGIHSRTAYNYSGFMELEMAETEYKLCISLSVTPRDYKVAVDVPSENYATDLYARYNFLKVVAIAYWKQFCEDHTTFIELVKQFKPDIDFSTLRIDPDNPTTLYFDPDCPVRVGIFCYYKDKNGKLFHKKG
jgi:hypothetical protein